MYYNYTRRRPVLNLHGGCVAFFTIEKGTLSSSHVGKLYRSIKLGEMDIVFPRSFSILSPRDIL